MTYLLLTALAVIAAAVVLAGHHVRRRATGRRWLPLREAMLHDAATLPSTFVAQIHTRPEPEAGGVVIATDLINGARGPLMLPGVNFRPGSVVCFTWTADGPLVRSWMSRRLWRVCTRQAERHRRQRGHMTPQTTRVREHYTDDEVRVAAADAVAAAEKILRDHSPS